MTAKVLETARLRLRGWREEDLVPFARMCADPQVMAFFPRLLSADETRAMVERLRAHFDRDGFGLWALEVKGGARFAGFVGLNVPSFTAPFTPCVEIGWRLAPGVWGHGYATEGARAALAFGFEQRGLEEIVSFTVPGNTRSRAVMERLGMRRAPADDFEHPALPEGHPLRPHVLYRLPRAEWSATPALDPAPRSG